MLTHQLHELNQQQQKSGRDEPIPEALDKLQCASRIKM
jgi:hypothetical protein